MNKNLNICSFELEEMEQREILQEMAMKSQRMTDKFSEVVGPIVDNLICICIYPYSSTVKHWRERAYELCERFVNVDVDPLKNNIPAKRFVYLYKGVVETLNNDYSALHNHYKSVSAYYAHREDPHKRLFPYKPLEECYEESKDRIISGIETLTRFTAKQDYEGMIEYMKTF